MLSHLADEELHALDMHKHFEEDEVKEAVQCILQDLGLKGNKLALPWIIEAARAWGTQEQLDAFKTEVPAPIRFFNDKFWTPSYVKHDRGAIDSLSASVKVDTREGGMCCIM